jgi:hypothetical protein
MWLRQLSEYSAVALCALLVAAGTGHAAARPALFRAGGATRSLAPSVPVYSGGFGLSPPIQRMHDALQARAFYVAGRHHAVAFATVDAQAYFAAYQEGGNYGITAVRNEAAARISALGGPKVTAADIIVQGTHTHAGPTLEGIWGPVPLSYLKEVRDRTVAALVGAARTSRTARLQWASIDAPYLDNINTAQTDSYQGWVQDGQLSVLRAVAPRSGATIATFANVPAHGDIVCGSCLKTLSADYFGAARTELQAKLGGTAIVGPATLGREESPIQTTGLRNMQWYGHAVTNLITRALAHARWITDPTVKSSQSFTHIPGTNAALLALVAAWHLPDAQKQQIADAGGIYPIDRANTPPYLTGNVLGTDLTAARIGPLAFLSMPGEPFPEVRYAIANAVRGASEIVALSKGQDDFGYFYPSFAYPFTVAYNSDHQTYNVAPQAGDQIVQEQTSNAGALGFQAHFDPARPLPNNYGQGAHPGLQALASPATGDVDRHGRFASVLQSIYSGANFGGSPLAGKVQWTFGDGTSAATDAVDFGGRTEARFGHRFPRGRHSVRLSAHDQRGDRASWSLAVAAYPRLCPSATARLSRGTWRLTGRVRGGDGHVLAWRWRYGTSHTAGRTIVIRGHRRPAAVLTVTDGTASTASVTLGARSRRADACAAPKRRPRFVDPDHDGDHDRPGER